MSSAGVSTDVVSSAASASADEGSRPSVLRRELWNLPNALTIIRIFFIPLFIWLLYEAHPISSYLAGVVFAVASITDVIDGFLARRWNQITVLGKFLDPLADKLIVMSAMVMMVRLGRLEAWVVILLLSREFIVTGLRQVAAVEGMVIAAGQEGKWKTALQLTGTIALCVHFIHPVFLVVGWYPVNFNLVGRVLVYASIAFSFWSAGVYFKHFLETLSRRSPAPS